MPPILYLIDGHALAYRTYFALTRGASGTFTTSKGEPTAGVFGFTSVLLRFLEQEHPDYLAVAFDVGRTFRDDLYPDYKGTREKMPDDLRTQIDRIRQLVDAFNIPRLEQSGYEADDVLGSVAQWAVNEGLGVKIITGDRDLLQLVDDRVIVSLPGRSISDSRDFLPDDVFEYMGVFPSQVVDFKSLVGDKSDNIPGVKGVGEKTAASLLKDFGDLESVYANLDEISPSVRKKLEVDREQAYLSQKLAKIITDLPVEIDLEQARPDQFDPKEIEGIFRELEFRTLMSRLEAVEEMYGKKVQSHGTQLNLFKTPSATHGVARSTGTDEIDIQIVDHPDALSKLVSELNASRMIAFDTETTSTDQMRADLVGISFAINQDRGYYVPVGHNPNLGEQLPLEMVMEALRAPLTNINIPKAGHNLKYDFVVMARNGLRIAPLNFDTMIAEWLVNPTSRNLGLKNLAWIRLNIKMTEIEELIGKGKKQISMAEVPISQAASYAGVDSVAVLRLVTQLGEELENRQAEKLFNEIEMPLVEVLADMEMTGICLDVDFLGKMSIELRESLDQIEKEIYKNTGETFNINSPQQLSQILFEKLKIPPPDNTRRTASGYYSTAASVLESLRGKHAVVDLVLDYRELAKLKSTYVDALPQQVNPVTGRVHTSYNQTGSVTGRIASSDPNLQNIPIRTELGRRVRQAFVASPGNILLSVDYSQVELRIVAHIAGDQSMLDAFVSGQDIHATTAAAIYGVSIEDVTKDQRRHAKAVNFGLIYGMSAFGLTRSTDLTLAEAEDFVGNYFERFPGVKNYLDGVRRQATDQEYVETLLGRRRYFPGLRNQKNRNIRNREEREAINAPIQGTAADIMKIAMLGVYDSVKRSGKSARMLLQVHDELLLECRQDELRETVEMVQNVMENAYNLSVPLVTDSRYGLNWDKMKTVKV